MPNPNEIVKLVIEVTKEMCLKWKLHGIYPPNTLTPGTYKFLVPRVVAENLIY